MENVFGGFGVIVFLFLIILAILWFFLPFAIFGTKDKLNELITANKNIEGSMDIIVKELKALNRNLQKSSKEVHETELRKNNDS